MHKFIIVFWIIFVFILISINLEPTQLPPQKKYSLMGLLASIFLLTMEDRRFYYRRGQGKSYWFSIQ